LTTVDLPTPKGVGQTLSQLDEAERVRRFDELQQLMPAVWDAMRRDVPNESVVVVPSMSLNQATSSGGALARAMEERSLFLLLLLRQPRLRMVYVTSAPIAESVVSYYLGLLSGVIPEHARSRLRLVAVGDTSPRPLSEKILERPRVLRRIRDLIPDRSLCHLIAYNTTEAERDVAIALGIPLYGPDPRHAALGGKSGCRRLFEELGVRHPLGRENLHSLDDVVDVVVDMRRLHPGMTSAIVKLNDGVSGAGNALVDLQDLPDPGSEQERAAVADRVDRMQLESPTVPRDAYQAKFVQDGGVVEERIVGVELLSPSVQMRVLPDGFVELLSTHDQLLGGDSGQSYLGCIFPADQAYSLLISRSAMVIGRRLAELGVIGRFAVDYVVVKDDAGVWTEYAIELNLRKGGTTHPFLTLQFLTGGSYDAERGVFLTPAGEARHLVATDHLEHEALKALSVDDLFDVVARKGLQFDNSRQRGAVFHMISCLTELGRIGVTVVGDSRDDAWQLYQRVERVLLDEAAEAQRDVELDA
jgi:pheganomycin biosynthesis PGM1-like protein